MTATEFDTVSNRPALSLAIGYVRRALLEKQRYKIHALRDKRSTASRKELDPPIRAIARHQNRLSTVGGISSQMPPETSASGNTGHIAIQVVNKICLGELQRPNRI
jgi:hypothetical protein